MAVRRRKMASTNAHSPNDSVFDLLSSATKLLTEEHRAALNTLMPMLLKDFEGKRFTLSGPSIMTASMKIDDSAVEKSDVSRLYKKIALLGTEVMTLDSYYIGKMRGVIFVFRPEPGCVAGYELDTGDLRLEMNLGNSTPLLVSNEEGAMKSFEETVREKYAGTNITEVIEQQQEMLAALEAEKRMTEITEKKTTYGETWGGWA